MRAALLIISTLFFSLILHAQQHSPLSAPAIKKIDVYKGCLFEQGLIFCPHKSPSFRQELDNARSKGFIILDSEGVINLHHSSNRRKKLVNNYKASVFKVFKSGNFLINDQDTLYKYKPDGTLVWQMDITFMKSDFDSYIFNLLPDESFTVLHKGIPVETIAYYENDDTRCSYEVLNPFDDRYCKLDNNVKNQVHGKIQGNLQDAGITIHNNKITFPAEDFGIEYQWYQDDVFKKWGYYFDLPQESHSYRVDVKQGSCTKSSETVNVKIQEPKDFFDFSFTVNNQDAGSLSYIFALVNQPIELKISSNDDHITGIFQKYINNDSEVFLAESDTIVSFPTVIGRVNGWSDIYQFRAEGKKTYYQFTQGESGERTCTYSKSQRVMISDSAVYEKAIDPVKGISSPILPNAKLSAPSYLSLDILSSSSYNSSALAYVSDRTRILNIGGHLVERTWGPYIASGSRSFSKLDGRALKTGYSFDIGSFYENNYGLHPNILVSQISANSDTYYMELYDHLGMDRAVIIDTSASLVADRQFGNRLDGIKSAYIRDTTIGTFHIFSSNLNNANRDTLIAFKKIDFSGTILDSLSMSFRGYRSYYVYKDHEFVFGDSLIKKNINTNTIDAYAVNITPSRFMDNLVFYSRADSLMVFNLDDFSSTFLQDSVKILLVNPSNTYLLKANNVMVVDNNSLDVSEFAQITLPNSRYSFHSSSYSKDFVSFSFSLNDSRQIYRNFLFDLKRNDLSTNSMFDGIDISQTSYAAAKLSQLEDDSYYATEFTLFKISPLAELLWAKGLKDASDYLWLLNEEKELVGIKESALGSTYQYMFALEPDDRRCSYSFKSNLPEVLYCKDSTMQLTQGFGSVKAIRTEFSKGQDIPSIYMIPRSFGIKNNWYQDGEFVKEYVSMDATIVHTYKVGVVQEGCEVLSDEVDYTLKSTLLTASPESISKGGSSQLSTFCGEGSELKWLNANLTEPNPIVSPETSTSYSLLCQQTVGKLYLGSYRQSPTLYYEYNVCLSDTATVYITVQNTIGNLNSELGTTIFPNPVSEQILHINTGLPVTGLRIYNQSGILMESIIGSQNSIKLNRTKYSAGTYLLNLDTATSTITKKFIIE